MKRVLIIVYYWPPSGGAGVQRWLKFAKYLPQYGWQPVIYTPENPDFSLKDESLLKEIHPDVEVIKRPIWEPYSVYRKLFSKKGKKEVSTGLKEMDGLASKMANWIRGNLFIPDPKVYWRKPSVNYLKNYVSKHPVDAIISSGTPHSMHLIGLDLKKELNLPWIADFRDPWTELDMLKEYHILPSVFKKYQKMESEVLSWSDIALTTSKVWAADLARLGAKRSECITNGYDESDFQKEVIPYKGMILSHFGLLNHLRNPTVLWEALEEILNENEDFASQFKLHLGGTIDSQILTEIAKYKLLNARLTVFNYLSHEEVIEEYLKSSILLLLLFDSNSGRGNIPGKLFEYLAAKKPILAFGPARGDAAEIVEEGQNGLFEIYSTNDNSKIKDWLLMCLKEGYEKNDKSKKYSRFDLTSKLALLLDQLTSK